MTMRFHTISFLLRKLNFVLVLYERISSTQVRAAAMMALKVVSSCTNTNIVFDADDTILLRLTVSTKQPF